MRKRHIFALLVAAGLTFGLSSSAAPTKQGALDTLDINTRVAILENRVDTMQGTLDGLHSVPEQLARIEEKLAALDAHQKTNTDTTTQVLMIALATIAGAGARSLFPGRQRRWDDEPNS